MVSLLLLVDLDVSFGERDHLGQNRSDVQVLHLVPLVGGLVKKMSSVRSFLRFAVMDNVGDQVVASFLVGKFVLSGEYVTKVNVSDE